MMAGDAQLLFTDHVVDVLLLANGLDACLIPQNRAELN